MYIQMQKTGGNNMEAKGNIFGYVRISTKDQNEDRQMIAMREFGVKRENIFFDKKSGKDFDRPQYRKMMARIHKGIS